MIAAVGLHPLQALRQHRQALHRLRVGIGMRLARADALDAMIDGADAGGEEQPFRRVHGEPGIEDRRARHHQGMPQHFLDMGALVGDAGDMAELAAGDGGGHADLPHGRRLERRRRRRRGPGSPSMPSTVETSLARQSCTALAPSVIEPPPTVTIRSAFAARAWLAAVITASRGVCAGIASKVPTQRGAQRLPDFFDLVGLAVQRAADHQERARRAQPVQLLGDRFRRVAPEHDFIHGAEYDTALVHAFVLPGHGGLCGLWGKVSGGILRRHA